MMQRKLSAHHLDQILDIAQVKWRQRALVLGDLSRDALSRLANRFSDLELDTAGLECSKFLKFARGRNTYPNKCRLENWKEFGRWHWYDLVIVADDAVDVHYIEENCFGLIRHDGKFVVISSKFLDVPETWKRYTYQPNEPTDIRATVCVRDKPSGFLVLTNPRSGTHMLGTALAQHSQLSCVIEPLIMGKQDGWNPKRPNMIPDTFDKYLTGRYSGICEHGYLGMPGSPSGMYTGEFKRFWDYVGQFSGKVIHLYRQNLVDRYISHRIAKRTDQWQLWDRKDQIKTDPITVNLDNFKKDREFQHAVFHRIRDTFPNRLQVTYEQLLEDFDKHYRRILEYIGVPYEPHTPKTCRAIEDHRKCVTNYHQMAALDPGLRMLPSPKN